MNRFKMEAFAREFPVLRELGRDFDDCTDVKAKRTDANLLARTPSHTEHIGSLVGIDEGDEVFLFDSDGSEIGKVRPFYTFGSNYAYQDGWTKVGESVLEAICKLHNAAQRTVSLVVWVEFGLGTVDHYSTREWSVTIYKPAHGFTLADALREAIQKAEMQVAAVVTL